MIIGLFHSITHRAVEVRSSPKEVAMESSAKFEIDISKFALPNCSLCLQAYWVILLLQLDAFSTLYAPDVESKGAAAYAASAIGCKEVAVII